MKKNIKEFFEDNSAWQQEYKLLRNILNTTGLEEEFKTRKKPLKPIPSKLLKLKKQG